MEPGVTMTGGDSGAPTTHALAVSLALGRLRGVVMLACLVGVISFFVQGVIWVLVTGTEIRWSDPDPDAVPLIVKPAADAIHRPRSLDEVVDGDVVPTREPEVAAVASNRVLSPLNGVLGVAARTALLTGSIAMLMLMPLMSVGVLLAASSATDGIEKVISAFTWACAVALLILPVGDWFGLSWGSGALWSYEELIAAVDMPAMAQSGLDFYARYLLLPIACMIALLLVAMRFSAGVKAGLVRREQLRLDPELEAETSGIKPGSLHGGRTEAAFEQAAKLIEQQNEQKGASIPLKSYEPGPPAAPAPAKPADSTLKTAAGDAPRRII